MPLRQYLTAPPAGLFPNAPMEIPLYPVSRPLERLDKTEFEEIFSLDPPELSELTFTNLYAWRNAYGFRVSRLSGFVVLSAESGGKRFFRPLGRGTDLEGCVRMLAGEHRPFIRIPARDRELFRGATGFREEADRDNADYLYSMEELLELKGKKFDGKRNFIKQFRQQYSYGYISLDDRTDRECLDFQDLWCREKGCAGDTSLAQEEAAVSEMCANFSFFGLVGGALTVGGKIRAIAIGQRLNPQTMVMHALKAMPGMKGAYQTMLNEFLFREGREFRFLNMEQDLGVEGLRKSKLSYQPLGLVEKFTYHG